MARYGVNARIVDKRAEKVSVGHADGLVPRTLELFDSCGFNHHVRHEGVPAVISTYWVCSCHLNNNCELANNSIRG